MSGTPRSHKRLTNAPAITAKNSSTVASKAAPKRSGQYKVLEHRVPSGALVEITSPQDALVGPFAQKLTEIKGGLTVLLDTIDASDMSAETVGALLNEVAASVSRQHPLVDNLTAGDAEFLVESGAYSETDLQRLEARVGDGELARRQRETLLNTISRTLTTGQVAERLQIGDSSVRHRVRDNHLYSFRAGKSRQYPLWQFLPESKRVVPGLTKIIPAFPQSWSPASVEGFMTTPQSDLPAHDDDEIGMTPVEWLASGGEVLAVVQILDRVGRG